MQIPDVVLYELLQWCVGNRGSKSGNPYCIPEIKAALKAIAHERGFKDVERNYFDALDGWTRTKTANEQDPEIDHSWQAGHEPEKP